MVQLILLFNREQKQKVLADIIGNILRTTFCSPFIFQVQTCTTFKNYLLRFYQKNDRIFIDIFGEIGYLTMISVTRERNIFAFVHYVYNYFVTIWDNPYDQYCPDVWCKNRKIAVESFFNILYPISYSEHKILLKWESKISYW